MAKLFTSSVSTAIVAPTNTQNSYKTNSECCSRNSCCNITNNIESKSLDDEKQTVQQQRYNKFFSNYSNYQNKFQQLISFSFTSTNFIFITCILSLSKICTTAATDPAHAATNNNPTNGPSLVNTFNSSVLLEKLNALRHNTFGVQGSAKTSKDPSPPSANSLTSGIGVNALIGGGKNFLQFDFKFFNISGKIGTHLGIANNLLNRCGEKQFQCKTGQCIPIRYVCDGESDCPDHSDEMVPECKNLGSICKSNEFRCSNGNCIPTRWLCDLENDCPDGVDEHPQHCRDHCEADEFKCNSTTKCIPKIFQCDGDVDCPDESDEKDCNLKCRADEFTCANGRECIQKRWVCDQDLDCRDGSDEVSCVKKECDNPFQFKCNSGLCIMKEWVCDGDNDCEDGSDEASCEQPSASKLISFCSPQEFACKDGITCVEKSWLCDGDKDCPDGEDESTETCKNVTCRIDQFKCKNNTCIPGNLVCNGERDCRNGEDEKDCSIRKETVCNATTHFNCGGGQCIDLSLVCDKVKHCPDGEDEPAGKCFVNECATQNGGCMHSCVDLPIGYECKCKEGYKLDTDGKTCVDINECDNPSTCSQICINRIGGYKCECIIGYIPHPNHHTLCKATEGHASLLLARRHDIRKISLEPWEMTSIINNTKSATALDFVFRTGMIFWSDVSTKTIYKAPIDEGNEKSSVVKEHSVTSDGLAVDWIYEHIYFTDSKLSTIEVSNFEGTMGKVLIEDAIDTPRSIALDPINGWMYWTDWGASPRIERAGMDGSHRTAIITYDVKWPNGLTLDMVRQRIYWVDGKLNTISSCNFDGSERKLILYSTEYLRHPFSITTFEDHLYWSDWDKQTVFKANKFNGENVESVTALHMLEHPMVIHVYHPYRQPDGVNYCNTVNGRCSHLCLPAPKINNRSPRISCACPKGLKLLQNGLTCGENTTEVEITKIANVDITTEPIESGSGLALTIIGCIVILGILVGGAFLGRRHCNKQTVHTINFENPVYHRTTEDVTSIEKGSLQKMIAPTVDEEMESSHRKLFAQY